MEIKIKTHYGRNYQQNLFNIARSLNINNPDIVSQIYRKFVEKDFQKIYSISKIPNYINFDETKKEFYNRVKRECYYIRQIFEQKFKGFPVTQKISEEKYEELKSKIKSMVKITFSRRSYCPFCGKTLIYLELHLFKIFQKIKPCSKLIRNLRKSNNLKTQIIILYQAMIYVYRDKISISFDEFNQQFTKYFNKKLVIKSDFEKACKFVYMIANKNNYYIKDETMNNDDDNSISKNEDEYEYDDDSDIEIINQKIKKIENKIKKYDEMKKIIEKTINNFH